MYFAEEAFPDVFIGSQNSTNDAWIEECFGKDVKVPSCRSESEKRNLARTQLCVHDLVYVRRC